MPESQRKRIYLLLDHPAHTEEWMKSVAGEPDLSVCGPAPDVPTAVDTIAADAPDVVIMNLAGNVEEEIALIEELRHQCRDLAILVLAMQDEAAHAERALRAGALGYLTTEDTGEEILPAIRQLLAGELYIGSRLSSKLLERLIENTRPPRGARHHEDELLGIEGIDDEDEMHQPVGPRAVPKGVRDAGK